MTSIQDKDLTKSYSKARLARDARFDGLFFTAVKSTGIYCRPICPANSPLEKNVEYFESAVLAGQSGYRPCLRCRPDSAPHSSVWNGTQTTFQRALSLIHQGALQEQSLEELAERLGISSRYLRELFQDNLGTSPKKVAIYQQCLFAKQLLHDSDLSIHDIAFASGFNSVRRFNETIKQHLSLTPREIRKHSKNNTDGLNLKLHYRPPFAWQQMLAFLDRRIIPSIEYTDTDCYGRTIRYGSSYGFFTIKANPKRHYFDLNLVLNEYQNLAVIVQKLRLAFDLDAPISSIDQQLSAELGDLFDYQNGLRIPGIWGTFEAGVRAILGQQVSVVAARNLVISFVEELGEDLNMDKCSVSKLFPEPKAVVDHPLDFLRMPGSRKDTLRRLAAHFISNSDPDNVDGWLDLKGIGPWTINYVKLRGTRDPDVWLAGDAGIKNAIQRVGKMPDLEAARPWRSYLTFQMWNQLT